MHLHIFIPIFIITLSPFSFSAPPPQFSVIVSPLPPFLLQDPWHREPSFLSFIYSLLKPLNYIKISMFSISLNLGVYMRYRHTQINVTGKQMQDELTCPTCTPLLGKTAPHFYVSMLVLSACPGSLFH